jgi:hypothetical protein
MFLLLINFLFKKLLYFPLFISFFTIFLFKKITKVPVLFLFFLYVSFIVYFYVFSVFLILKMFFLFSYVYYNKSKVVFLYLCFSVCLDAILKFKKIKTNLFIFQVWFFFITIRQFSLFFSVCFVYFFCKNFFQKIFYICPNVCFFCFHSFIIVIISFSFLNVHFMF